MKSLVVVVVLIIFSLAAGPTIPVIFVHRTNSPYLHYSLAQALEYNDRVIMLGDESNRGYEGIEHYNASDYFVGAKYFKTIYEHFAVNSYKYELFCFQRWFVLNEFIKKHGIQEFFYCDSDVMLYSNITQEYEHYCHDDAAIMVTRSNASGGISYWKAHTLDAFCDFVIDYYEDPVKVASLQAWFNDPAKPPSWGVCDMTLFRRFYDHDSIKSRFKVSNILAIIDDAQFDFHIGHEEYGAYDLEIVESGTPYETLIKKMRWRNNQPWVFNKHLQKFIRFKSLHFQGPRRKHLMRYYY